MAQQKNKKQDQQATTQATQELPVVHVLALLPDKDHLFTPVHIITHDTSILGVRVLSDPLRRDQAFDQVKIATVRLFKDRQAFAQSTPDKIPADLQDLVLPSIQAIGIIKTKDGKHVPLTMKLEGETVKSAEVLFGSPLTLSEALSVYKSRAVKLFVNQLTLKGAAR